MEGPETKSKWLCGNRLKVTMLRPPTYLGTFLVKTPSLSTSLILTISLLSTTAQATDLPLANGLRAALKEGDALAQQRHQLETDQQRLLAQKQTLDARGARLAQRQDDMNRQVEAQNHQVGAQKQDLQRSRAECNKDTVATQESSASAGMDLPHGDHADDENKLRACNAQIAALNQKTQDIDNTGTVLQTQQNSLELDYTQYNLDLANWTDQEEQEITELNQVYEATNSWFDTSYDLLVSDSVDLLVKTSHNATYCSGDSLPDGHLTQRQLAQGADYLLACFHRLAKALR